MAVNLFPAPKLVSAKHISKSVVIKPPLPILPTAKAWSSIINSVPVLNALLKKRRHLFTSQYLFEKTMIPV
jgi:hypothetical protein